MSLHAPALSALVKSPLDLIGKTPMVEVTKIDTGKCRLLLKLESQNPGGSIKDRIAVEMLDLFLRHLVRNDQQHLIAPRPAD